MLDLLRLLRHLYLFLHHLIHHLFFHQAFRRILVTADLDVGLIRIMRINSVTNVSLIFGVISDTIINVVVSLVWLGGGRRVLITDIRLLLRLTGSRLGGVGILLLLLQRGLLQVRSYGGHLVIGLLIAIHAVSRGSRSGGLGRLLGLKLLYLLLGLVDILPWKLVTVHATCSKLMKTYPLSLSSLVGLPMLQLRFDLLDNIGHVG